MGTSDNNPLVDAYQNRIGVPSTGDEAYGYWVFVIGVLAGFIGIALVMLSQEPGESIRGVGIAVAALGLVLLLIGPIIRLPLKRGATILSYLGGVVALAGVVWFFLAFQAGNWSADFSSNEVLIIGVYGLGIFGIVLGSIFVPLLTSPREEQMAAEDRAATAEAGRDAAIEEAEQRAREAEAEAERAREEAERAASEQSERERLAAELEQIEASQSQFELYTDRGGKHRWRLRHQNRNIIADSAQGYSSRQSAQRGLSAVRRDAFGASVVDLDELEEEVEVEEVDDAVEGEEAPEFVEDASSDADFETYEDSAGEHRWRLRHDNGEIIADSGQGYSSADSRDDGVERVRGYVQSADYLRIDPAAFELFQDKGGKYRWRLLHRNGNILADSGQGYASRQKARQGIDSVQRNAGEDGNAEFEIYEDNAGEYRWRLTHQNGNIIADGGEGYASESGAEDAVGRMTEYAPEAHVLDVGSAAFEIYEDAAEKWRWRLRHRNGRILADSGQGYASRSGAEDGINSVKRNAPNADVTAAE
ncbi:HVO_2922 family protein [Halovenus sp. HT40]|uniref:HVO_2922 family protein n=1 Tax=Halovenus sp. HT40 TaxID=3126691 RepID=UPI00300F6ED0